MWLTKYIASHLLVIGNNFVAWSQMFSNSSHPSTGTWVCGCCLPSCLRFSDMLPKSLRKVFLSLIADKRPVSFSENVYTFQRKKKVVRITHFLNKCSKKKEGREISSLIFHKQIKLLFLTFICLYSIQMIFIQIEHRVYVY